MNGTTLSERGSRSLTAHNTARLVLATVIVFGLVIGWQQFSRFADNLMAKDEKKVQLAESLTWKVRDVHRGVWRHMTDTYMVDIELEPAGGTWPYKERPSIEYENEGAYWYPPEWRPYVRAWEDNGQELKFRIWIRPAGDYTGPKNISTNMPREMRPRQ